MKNLIKRYGREKRLGYAGLEDVKASMSHNPMGFHSLLQG
jgi:hypothetical protein